MADGYAGFLCYWSTNILVSGLPCKAGMQSTIDMLNFWRDSKLVKEGGSSLVHPYNLGPKRNFQVSATACPAAWFICHLSWTKASPHLVWWHVLTWQRHVCSKLTCKPCSLPNCVMLQHDDHSMYTACKAATYNYGGIFGAATSLVIGAGGI